MSITVDQQHPVSAAPVQALRGLYSLEDAPAVMALIGVHPELAALLVEAHQQTERHFPGHRLTLSVAADPEQDAAPRLRLGISTPLDGGAALLRLGMLDEAWWLDTLPRTGRSLFINLDFENG